MINFIQKKQEGFTLVEIAIVLLIVTILLGFTVAMFPKQQELKLYREAQSEMSRINQYLIAFAQINGRLPCPDTSAGAGAIDGVEDAIAGGCEAYFGFLPRATIGINGDVDQNTGNLLDPWGQPYYYHVSAVDTTPDGVVDIVVANGVQSEGLANVVLPDLHICSDNPSTGNDTACAAGESIIDNVSAVIISTGKDVGAVSSNIQDENTDDLHDGTNDKVYVYSTISDASGSEYDDIVKWISPNILYSKMIEADQLP